MPHREQPLRVPDPILSRSRKSAFKRVVRSLFVIALVTGVIAGGAIVFAYTQFTAKGPLVASTVYQVNQGMKRSEIGAELQDAGIVSSAGIFTAAAYVNTLSAPASRPASMSFRHKPASSRFCP